MGAKEVIELLILAVSLIAPIIFNFIGNKVSVSNKKPYKLPSDGFYLETLISSIKFLLLLGLYGILILSLVYLSKSNITYTILFILGILTYNFYESYLNKKLKRFSVRLDKKIMWFHNVKCKMRVQSFLISLALVYGLDNIFSFSSSGNKITGWMYFGLFIITLPAYAHVYLLFFKSQYTKIIYEVRMVNDIVYKAENIYEAKDSLMVVISWDNNEGIKNYLELKKEYISSVAVNTEVIDIKSYLKHRLPD